MLTHHVPPRAGHHDRAGYRGLAYTMASFIWMHLRPSYLTQFDRKELILIFHFRLQI